MRKFQNMDESDDLLDELLEGIELSNAQAEEEEHQEELKAKKEKKEKKKKEKKEKSKESKEEKEETPEEKLEKLLNDTDKNGIPVVLERIEAGLIGSLKITDNKINAPIFKEGDLAQLRKPNRLLPRDFVFYKIQDDYFLRRIIKFKEDDIYVAGDNEKEYHVIRKENIIAKAVGRERGKTYLSLSFNPKNKFYTFRKVNLAPIRLGNRIKTYDEDMNKEAFEAAMQKIEVQAAQPAEVFNQQIAADLDLDSDLKAFLDPDDLVRELRGEGKVTSLEKEEEPEEEIIYVDENGNEITKEEYEAMEQANQEPYEEYSSESEDTEEPEEEDEEFHSGSIDTSAE